MLTFELACDFTANVQANSTEPGTCFFGLDHYTGCSPLHDAVDAKKLYAKLYQHEDTIQPTLAHSI